MTRLLSTIQLLAFMLVATAQLHAAPVELDKIEDILIKWSPENRVYFVGDVGLGASQLKDLDGWVLKNAPHWTILLAPASAGTAYKSSEGTQRSGFQAVEYIMGQGLANRTKHGQLSDPKTGTRDGVAFTILTQDRKIIYSPSDLQKQFDVGRQAWENGLDKIPIASLKNGMRIQEAVEKTVDAVQGKITRTIQQKEAEQTRRIAEWNGKFDQTMGDLRKLEQRITEFKKANPNVVEGPVMLLEERKQILSSLKTAQPGSEASLLAIAESIWGINKWISDYPNGADYISWLRNELEKIKNDRHSQQISTLIRNLELNIRRTEIAYKRGSDEFSSLKDAAGDQVVQARQTLQAIEKNIVLLKVTCALAALLLLLLLAYLNVRRRGEKRAALELLLQWKDLLHDKTNALLTLLSDGRLVVGSINDAEERFSGVSLERAKETIRSIDELFILSTHLHEIVSKAEQIAHPAGLGLLSNTFFKAPYRRIHGLLTDSKVSFDPRHPLKKLVTKEGEVNELLGRIADYKPFEVSLDSLIAVFNSKAESVTQALKDIGEAWPKAAEYSDVIESGTERLQQLDPNIFPALFHNVIPELVKGYGNASVTAAKDALAALTELEKLATMASESQTLTAMLSYSETESGAEAKAIEALTQSQISSDWIQQTKLELRKDINHVLQNCSKTPVPTEIETLKLSRNSFVARVSAIPNLCELLQDLRSKLTKISFSQDQRDVHEALLAAGLHGPQESLLLEPNLNVASRQEHAVAQEAGASGELSRGATKEALLSLQEGEKSLEEAKRIKQESLLIVERYPSELASTKEAAKNVRAKVAPAEESLVFLKTRFLESALKFGMETVSDNLEEISEFDRAANTLIAESEEELRCGKLFKSAQTLTLAARAIGSEQRYIDEIHERKAELEALVAENAKLTQGLTKSNDALQSTRDAFASRESNRAFAATFAQQIAELTQQQALFPQDPILLNAELSNLNVQESEMRAAFKNDADLFSLAKSAVEVAGNQLKTMNTLDTAALRQGAAPSPALLEARSELEKLKLTVDELTVNLSVPHSDWHVIQKRAAIASARSGELIVRIRGELKAAEVALASIKLAQQKVRAAAGWSGRHGIRIKGTPGRNQISDAEAQLARGRYDLSRAAADQAMAIASSAIAEADAMVRRHEQAEALKRAERAAARRARNNDSSVFGSFGGSSSSNDSSSGWSSRSSDSGSSSSSFSSDSGSSSSDSGSSSSDF